MSHLFFLLKQAWNSLIKKPGFVFSVVITMGITFGALLNVSSLAYLLFVKPLPYPEPDRLFQVESVTTGKNDEYMHSAYTYAVPTYLYKKQSVFSQTALIYHDEIILKSLPSHPHMNLSYVSPEWFDLLKPKMILGRYFDHSGTLNTNIAEVILSYKTWQKDFLSDDNILNRKLSLAGNNYRIIGVVSPDFAEPQIYQTGLHTELWLPWSDSLAAEGKNNWQNINGSIQIIGKLKQEFSEAQASNALTPLINNVWKENTSGIDFMNGWNTTIKLHSLKSSIIGESANSVYFLIAGVFGLLLVASTNISNLFMSRTSEQLKSFAIRAAMGATKKILFRTILIESAVLMSLSTVIGLLIAWLANLSLRNYLTDILPRADELNIDGFTLIMGLNCIVCFGYLFAKLSFLMVNYPKLNLALRLSGKSTGIQVSKIIRKLLIVSQITAAATLIFINIILFSSSVKTLYEPLGFKVKDRISANLFFSDEDEVTTNEEKSVILNNIKNQLLMLPQVESVERSDSPMLNKRVFKFTEPVSNKVFLPEPTSVSEGYFSILEQPLLEGDYFSAEDIRDNNLVVIINNVFAKELSPAKSVLGMKISDGVHADYTIKGVVEGAKIPGYKGIPNRIFLPGSLFNTAFLIKLKSNHDLTRAEFAKLVSSADERFSVDQFSHLTTQRNQLLLSKIMTAITSAVLGLLSLIMAALGLYGVLSYGIQMRRFELATRLAIGAKRKDIVLLIIKDSLSAIFAGILICLTLLFLLYISFSDELLEYINIGLLGQFSITLSLIGLISITACYLPLRKIINYPPIKALRGIN